MATNPAAPTLGVDEHGQLPLPWLGDALQRAKALTRAHALLAHGPAGSGHLEFAWLWAQHLLCEEPGQAPCGRCTGCHLVRVRAHPDLLVVLPAALRDSFGWEPDEVGAKTRSDAKPSRDIRIAQVRHAIDWARQTPGRGRGKVLVLHPADALNGPAGNALLKTLEEPPASLRLMLTSVDPEQLLPTVRSRCQRLPLPLPPPDQAQAWLAAQGVADPACLLALAGGSPLEALALSGEGIDAAWVAALPRAMLAGDARALQGRPVPRVVELLSKLAHDAMASSVGGVPRFFPGSSVVPAADHAAWSAWQRALVRTSRHDGHPWHAPLLIESLVTQASTVWPAPAPGRAGRGTAR
ncbi:DNA polymerase III subunit delta' [Ideonella sp. A 288]|uniref:DNA polymerase III subunit delta' n=1 Tax=Ideonella sp. A 288 TaxID=1962181 RepID=UPI000B4AAE94|nr:DNA polymerase III subunit delta' [Ideonella sp. A 288]